MERGREGERERGREEERERGGERTSERAREGSEGGRERGRERGKEGGESERASEQETHLLMGWVGVQMTRQNQPLSRCTLPPLCMAWNLISCAHVTGNVYMP
jgi:hypothetical protein